MTGVALFTTTGVLETETESSDVVVEAGILIIGWAASVLMSEEYSTLGGEGPRVTLGVGTVWISSSEEKEEEEDRISIFQSCCLPCIVVLGLFPLLANLKSLELSPG